MNQIKVQTLKLCSIQKLQQRYEVVCVDCTGDSNNLLIFPFQLHSLNFGKLTQKVVSVQIEKALSYKNKEESNLFFVLETNVEGNRIF